MAHLYILKSTLCPASSISRSNFPRTSSSARRSVVSSSLLVQRRNLSVCCVVKDGEDQSNGEEPPESLFMKELRRRGMTPTSLLEETQKGGYGVEDDEMILREGERVFSKRNAVSTEINKELLNQRERSMALNSEGLEGLIPRARLLLTIGGTFFLAFGPLILITVGFFTALYLYFGASFLHDGSTTPVSPPQYIDPYALLEDERISEIAPTLK